MLRVREFTADAIEKQRRGDEPSSRGFRPRFSSGDRLEPHLTGDVWRPLPCLHPLRWSTLTRTHDRLPRVRPASCAMGCLTHVLEFLLFAGAITNERTSGSGRPRLRPAVGDDCCPGGVFHNTHSAPFTAKCCFDTAVDRPRSSCVDERSRNVDSQLTWPPRPSGPRLWWFQIPAPWSLPECAQDLFRALIALRSVRIRRPRCPFSWVRLDR